MNFLPDDYEAPQMGGGYMKIQKGENGNRIRILSKPIVGWLAFLDKRPKRTPFNQAKPASVDPKNPVRHFWAFIVYNYDEGAVQILEVTQAQVRKPLEILAKDKDWGAPFFYDIRIKKEGEGILTKYSVTPLPGKPVSQDIIDAFNAKRANLDALWDNSDPFAEGQSYTPGIFSKDDLASEVKPKHHLLVKLEKCKPEFQGQVKAFLVNSNLSLDMSNLNDATEAKLEKSIGKHLAEIATETDREMDRLFGGANA